MPPDPTPPEEMSEDRLRFERDEARMERDLARQKLDHIDHMLNTLWVKHGLFMENLDSPHYLTSKELTLYKNKGFEVVFLHWQKELAQIDKERAKRCGFPLPEKRPPGVPQSPLP